MADYRLSAKPISRAKGQSSVASAAYRSGEELVDERTGDVHDYTRKKGVLHTEVMVPKGTPSWMEDRSQLWNAVEAVERRKDAQLSREVQLSLPHELTPEQRKELVQGFVRQEFVARGMIADIALHAPSQAGDERNHHAHVVLTMREITSDGFGKKVRAWNSSELLNTWREKWAHHQNKALERHGHVSRVSHLSYEAQGIDREAGQHLGPVATQMERQNKPSRIGDKNRQIANDNALRAQDHAKFALLSAEIAQRRAQLNQSQKHERHALEQRLRATHHASQHKLQRALQAVETRLQSKGIRKLLRAVTGTQRADQQQQAALQKRLELIEVTKELERETMRVRHKAAQQKQNQIDEARRQTALKLSEKTVERDLGKRQDKHRQIAKGRSGSVYGGLTDHYRDAISQHQDNAQQKQQDYEERMKRTQQQKRDRNRDYGMER